MSTLYYGDFIGYTKDICSNVILVARNGQCECALKFITKGFSIVRPKFLAADAIRLLIFVRLYCSRVEDTLVLPVLVTRLQMKRLVAETTISSDTFLVMLIESIVTDN